MNGSEQRIKCFDGLKSRYMAAEDFFLNEDRVISYEDDSYLIELELNNLGFLGE